MILLKNLIKGYLAKPPKIIFCILKNKPNFLGSYKTNKMKNKFIAVIGGFLALFGLGYVIYVKLFNDPSLHFGHESGVVLEEPNFLIIILMEVLYAKLLTVILGHWDSVKSFGSGIVPGLTIGAFIGLTFALYLYGTSTLVDLNVVVFYTLTFAVRFAVAGGVIGWALNMNSNK